MLHKRASPFKRWVATREAMRTRQRYTMYTVATRKAIRTRQRFTITYKEGNKNKAKIHNNV